MNGTIKLTLDSRADLHQIADKLRSMYLPGVLLVEIAPNIDKKERPRNPVFDALAVLDCPNLDELTPSAASRVAKALQNIRSVCPNVTPEEIERRSEAYRQHMPHATLTSTALAAHWGRCAAPPAPRVRPDNTPHWKLIQDLQKKIDTHPANPRWVGYIREDVTHEQTAELMRLREHMGNLTMYGQR